MEYKHMTIAVVGASSDSQKYGHRIFRDLLESGYTVVGVNPKADTIHGQHIYASLKDIPKVPDMVITVVPPHITSTIVDECHVLGIQQIWMQPGSESEEVIRKAQEYGIKTTSACFMTVHKIW